MALSAAKALYKEFRTFNRLLQPAPLVFFAEDSFSYLVLEGYLKQLLQRFEGPLDYVTMEEHDPVLASEPPIRAHFLRAMAHQFLQKTRHPILVMTMPDLGSMHVARPSVSTRCVYLFHAMVSIHRQYREDAFDNYDDIFCVGDHHVQELEKRFKMIGRPCPRLHPVGYHKLDRIALQHRAHVKRHGDRPVVLLAPSWHPENLLESVGPALVESLLAQEYRVVVRPHPAFFASIYPRGLGVIEAIRAQFAQHPHFQLDLTMNSELSFHEADLLLTDWSGSAFEYAFGTERPVISVDTPAKVRNDNWQALGIEPFEVRLRDEIGHRLPPAQAGQVGLVARRLLEEKVEHAERLRDLRSRSVFHFGQSAQVGGELLRSFLT